MREIAGDFKLHAADPNAEARRVFAEANPQATMHDDAAAMLASPSRDDDIVVNATPPVLHHGLTIAALDSGRHVLCGKPLAMDADEARSMLRRARERGRRLGCCSNRMLANPATDAVAELIREGALGRPYHVTWIERRVRGRTGIEY